MTIEKNGKFPERDMLARRSAISGFMGMLTIAMAGIDPLNAAATSNTPFISSRISITVRGERTQGGRDVLLIPGLASGPGIWTPLLSRLQGHRFHLVHIAGFAGRKAGANANGPLLDPLAGELARYLAEKRISAPAIIGHSMGGTLAIMLGLRAGTKPNRIMVVDMLPDAAGMLGGTSDGLGYIAGQLNSYFTGTKAGRQLLAEMVRQAPGSRDSDPQVIAQALTELARTDLTARLRMLGCPLNVIYAAAADRQVAVAQRRRYEAAYASTRTLALSGVGPSGHMVMLDQPDKFAGAVREFLK